MIPTSDFVVKVGNGQQVTSLGFCKGIEVQFPNLLVTQDCYLFPLEGSEMVLGLAWLDTLGISLPTSRNPSLYSEQGIHG